MTDPNDIPRMPFVQHVMSEATFFTGNRAADLRVDHDFDPSVAGEEDPGASLDIVGSEVDQVQIPAIHSIRYI